MTRPLGSFNNQVNLIQHKPDHQAAPMDGPVKYPEATLGYQLGFNRNVIEPEPQTPSNAEKFVSGQGGKRKPGIRMAGQALGQDIRRGPGLPKAFTLPIIGEAEQRVLNPS